MRHPVGKFNALAGQHISITYQMFFKKSFVSRASSERTILSTSYFLTHARAAAFQEAAAPRRPAAQPQPEALGRQAPQVAAGRAQDRV